MRILNTGLFCYWFLLSDGASGSKSVFVLQNDDGGITYCNVEELGNPDQLNLLPLYQVLQLIIVCYFLLNIFYDIIESALFYISITDA